MADYFEELGANLMFGQEEGRPPLINIARFLLQMGILDSFDTHHTLAPAASKKCVEDLQKTLITKYEDIDECPICLRHFAPGDTQVVMPCKHSYHDSCILKWLNQTNSCPVCRFELPTDDEVYELFRKEREKKATREETIRQLHNSMYG